MKLSAHPKPISSPKFRTCVECTRRNTVSVQSWCPMQATRLVNCTFPRVATPSITGPLYKSSSRVWKSTPVTLDPSRATKKMAKKRRNRKWQKAVVNLGWVTGRWTAGPNWIRTNWIYFLPRLVLVWMEKVWLGYLLGRDSVLLFQRNWKLMQGLFISNFSFGIIKLDVKTSMRFLYLIPSNCGSNCSRKCTKCNKTKYRTAF